MAPRAGPAPIPARGVEGGRAGEKATSIPPATPSRWVVDTCARFAIEFRKNRKEANCCFFAIRGPTNLTQIFKFLVIKVSLKRIIGLAYTNTVFFWRMDLLD
jgi:hypothetical protein